MVHYKISKLLNISTLSKFVTRKWIELNDLSNGQYSTRNNIRFKTFMLRPDLRDYNNSYILVKGTKDILTVAANKNDKAQKNIVFKNNTAFTSCISKNKSINSTLIDNTEDLDIVIAMYNMSEFSEN